MGVDVTYGFRLSYRGRDPETVAQVTNALAALYIEENARMREQQAAGTTQFLQTQLEDARRQMEDQERRITAFKEHHIGDLPEQQAVNLAAIARLNEQVHVIENRQNELTKQMNALRGADGDTVSARLATLQQELANLRMRDTDEHPDVVRVKEEITGIERQLAIRSGGPGGDPTAPRPTPRTAAEIELAALRTEEHRLQSRIATYEQRVENAPLIEQELHQLSQDYAAAKDLYQSLLQRYQSAQLIERMDQRQAEQFRILDPAVVSHQPVGPHRFRLLLMGLMLSAGAAVGAALVADAADTSFHTVDDLRIFTNVPVLASIPPIITAADIRRRRRQFSLATLAAVLGLAVVAGISLHLAHSEAVVGLLAQGHF
jgi:polysaccharide chain length determinant protein (PEP-CTERM system associated)